MAGDADERRQGREPLAVGPTKSGGWSVSVDATETLGMIREMARAAKPAARRKFLKNAGVVMLRMEAKIFKFNGIPLGQKWRALSPVTVRRRKKGRGAGGAQILRDTGRLRASVSGGRMSGGGLGSIRRTGANDVAVGTNLSYAKAHQYGLPRRKGQVKAHTRRLGRTKRGKLKKSVMRDRASTLGGRAYLRGIGGSASTRMSGTIVHVRAHSTTLPAIPARPFVGWTRNGIADVLALANEYFIMEPAKRNRTIGAKRVRFRRRGA